MTFTEIWTQIVYKWPKSRDPEYVMAFRSKHLKDLLKQVYKKGKESKREPDGFDDIFDDLV